MLRITVYCKDEKDGLLDANLLISKRIEEILWWERFLDYCNTGK